MFNYAQIKDGIVVAVQQSTSEISKEGLISIPEYSTEIINKLYMDGDFIDQPPRPIRIISTGAMQRRFTIPEEVFISGDAAATVIKSRLINSAYCDLDFQDVIDGINYICGVLQAGGVIADATARAIELLQDGVSSEQP
ncbi:hypothetical protein [Thalassotalea profundi]|uniref:Uncharacterized protein n=1 Tax=Thalassotalea profundi TaxID=2036687 RepID=A0ABQ3IQ43_9GAMM|nr:hypothetical protein [Thalassotalea profundi]GHE87495.1 hypothetical protein GCM10011501_16220 [Thalassotalea profundi]